MRHYKLIPIALFWSFQALSQEPEPLLVSVDYAFTHIHDTTDRSHPLKENMSLYVAANSASYRRSPATAPPPPPSASGNAGAAPAVTRVVVGGPMAVVYAHGYTDYELLQYPAQNKYQTISRIGMSNYAVDYPLPVIDWQIGQQTKTIGDYTCQQATGTYAGRTYTAWFSTELPFRYGPWKLSGLPGLILEARDASGDISFTCIAVNKPQPDQKHRYPSNKLISASAQAVAKAREAFDENPVTTMQSQLSQGAPAPMLTYRDITGKSTTGADAQPLIDQKRKTAKTFINNPIERQ